MDDLEQTLAEFDARPNNPRPKKKRRRRKPRCASCNALATCYGAYEEEKRDTYACDDCCGHGCEDGLCRMLQEVK